MPVVDGPIERERYMPDARELGAGAVATFEGIVRSSNNERDDVTAIYYECYREMVDREFEDIAAEVQRTHAVSYIKIVHRIGLVPVGELSLFVVVASRHRKDAFESCQMLVESLKKRAPLWKKEQYRDDSAKWI